MLDDSEWRHNCSSIKKMKVFKETHDFYVSLTDTIAKILILVIYHGFRIIIICEIKTIYYSLHGVWHKGLKTFHNSTINKVPRTRKGKTSLELLGVPEIPQTI